MLQQVELKPDMQVLEPAGGDGAFVRGLLQQGVPSNNITVWDLDPAREEALAQQGVEVVIQDSLLDVDFQSPDQQFDLVVGNPPYLSKQSEYIQAHKQQLRKRFPEISAAETYGLFLLLGIKLLRPGGELIFIISDSYRSIQTHQKLRRWLLEHTTLHQIALMPDSLFQDKGVSVKTSVIHLQKGAPPADHQTCFRDFRQQPTGKYEGPKIYRKQQQLSNRPGARLTLSQNPDITQLLCDPPGTLLGEQLVGGIGLHTPDNTRFMARMQYPGETLADSGRVPKVVPASKARDPESPWRILHKRGGQLTYYERPRYAIRWTPKSQQSYMGPQSFWQLQQERKAQSIVLISGVADQLSARLGSPGGVWYSNKCFGFFPRNPEKYPPAFFVGLLNSQPYRACMKVISHTASMQLSDLQALPRLFFSQAEVAAITDQTRYIIETLQDGGDLHREAVAKIDQLVQTQLQKMLRQGDDDQKEDAQQQTLRL